jgi:coiled-coil domain-containing protein 130
MSSLAAAKADNFYFPEDFDPQRHRTLNRYHGQHALRDRARADGALVVRFEVPFPLSCSRCGEAIGKGVRFNAEKREAGSYHSTKVWRFEMQHHCGSLIVVQTDPANADYVVVSGARRRASAGRAALAPEGELDAEEEAALLGGKPADAVPREHAVGREKAQEGGGRAGAANAADPMASLELASAAARRAAERTARLEALERMSSARHASGTGLHGLNRALRDRMRAARDEERGLEAERKHMGVAESVRLLPASRDDARRAAATMAAASRKRGGEQGVGADDEVRRRRRILSESIFGGGGGGAGGGAAAALAAARANNSSKREAAATATTAAAALPSAAAPPRPNKPPPPASSAVAAWAPPLVRKRR